MDKIRVDLFAQADTGDLVTVDAGMMGEVGERVEVKASPVNSSVTEASDVERVEVSGATSVVVEAQPVREITVGVIPVWGVALGWLLTIIAVSQALKYLLEAMGIKNRLQRFQWKRWQYVLPLCVGIVLAALFGPELGKLFGLRFGVLSSVLFLGPGSGAAAAFGYDVLRGVVLPLLPSTIIGIIERVTGLTLPERAKAEAKFLEEESEESDG